MLVNLKDMLMKADKNRYAVGAFNMTSLETALGVAEAAEAERSPVILAISEKTIDYMGLDLAVAIGRTLAGRVTVPMAVHLDHGKNFELTDQALKAGFSSIMLDVSKMAKDERIPFVRDYVKRAHLAGLTVEAEEDMIGGREDYIKGEVGHLSDPKRAATFVKQTGVDCFAVSIGSAHGQPLPHEHLDMELLYDINKAVSVPLVLHGASSTPETTTREAIARGICKINIDTDLRLAFTRQLRRTLEEKDLYDPRDELQPSIEEVKTVVIEKMRLFGSSGKA